MHECIKTQMQSIAATNNVFNNIEPQDLKNTDNQSLDQYGPARLISDLKTAASNVHAASEKYAEILKEERSKLEGYVRSLSVPERFIGAFLQSVDKRQDASKKTIGNVLKAHDDVYHILANIAEILLKSGSRYKVQNGRVVFYDNVLLTEYNSAALSLQQSLKRLSDAQNDVRKFVERSQQNWNDSFK
jgi:hypothetical protein